jgi:hypothetical protein
MRRGYRLVAVTWKSSRLHAAAKRLDRPAFVRARLAVHQEAHTLSYALPGRGGGLWPGFGEPFNGQHVRLRAVRHLIASHHPDVFLETGTFFGFTTRFFVGRGAPVYSVEIKRTYHALARLRLGWGAPELRLRRGHSLEAISELRGQGFARPFVYLDAHWWAELPLAREVGELLAGDGDVLIVVDDARVPDDDGYAHDSHDGVALGLGMLDLSPDVAVAFPAIASADETGARRGTLYLARGPRATAALRSAVDEGLLRAVCSDRDELVTP